MTTFTERRVVAADSAAVAALVLDWNQDTRWRDAVRDIRTEPGGAASVGQRIVETLRFAGRTFVTPTMVTAVTATSAEFEGGSATVAVTGRREVTAASPATGSIVTISLTIRMTGAMAPLTPLLAPGYRQRHRDDMDRLAALLDTTPLSPDAP